MPLDHKNLGAFAPGGGLNYDIAGRTLNATTLSDFEAQASAGFKHRRGILEPRYEFSPLIGPSTSSYTFKFPGGANPTGRINGLFHNVFESGTYFMMIHDKAHFWSFDGTTITNRTGALAFGSSSDSTPYSGTFVIGPSTSTTGGYYVFSNGAMELAYWNGVAASADHVKNLAGYITPGVTLIAKYIVSFAGRCFLWSTVEGGNSKDQRGRWCADSDLLDWDPANGTGAGAVDLVDTPGRITGAIATPELMAIFKEDAVVLAQETGDARVPIAFPTYFKTGCLSQGSVQAISPQQIIFLGTDNIYMLEDGGTTPIGGKIRNKLYAELDFSRLRQIVSWRIPDLSEYYISIPLRTITSGYAVMTYCYNWLEDKWTSQFETPTYNSPITAACVTNVSATTTWTSISGTWSANGSSWSALPSGGQTQYTPMIAMDYASGDSRVNTFSPPGLGYDLVSASQAPIVYFNQSKDYQFYPMGEATIYGIYVEFYAPGGSGFLGVTLYGNHGAQQQTVTKAFTASTLNRLYFPFSMTATVHSLALATTGVPIYITSVSPITIEREEINY